MKINKDLGKPDFESESFRAWSVKKDKFNEKEFGDNPKIKYKGFELSLVGFKVFYASKDKKKVVFAWKVKPDQVLFWRDEKVKELIKVENLLKKFYGDTHEVKDMKDILTAMKHEEHVLKNLKKK